MFLFFKVCRNSVIDSISVLDSFYIGTKRKKKTTSQRYLQSRRVRSPPHTTPNPTRRRRDIKFKFGLTCGVGADTRNLDYTRRPIRHPVRDIRRRYRIRFVCTRRPTATELVSARHRLMAVLRRVETPWPLENDTNVMIYA